MHNYAYDFHEHNPRRKPNPKDTVNCVSCRGTGLVHGAQAHYLGGRVIRCTSCGGYGWVRASYTARPSLSGGVSFLKPGMNPDSSSELEWLMEAVEQVVSDSDTVDETDRQSNADIQANSNLYIHADSLTYPEGDEEDAVDAEQERVLHLREHTEEEERRAAARERAEEQERLEQERIERLRTARLQAEAEARLREEAAKKAERKGRVGRALRRSFAAIALLSVLVVFGGGIAAFMTGTTLDEIIDSVGQSWSGFGIGDVGGESQPPNSEGPTSPVIPVTPSPTATATATPTPTPAPTATAVAISPWAGFAISRETLGREMLGRLSDEEIACIRSTNSEAFYEYFEALPLGVRILTNPPVHDVSDLPQLSDCLTAESTMQLNLAIAQFHDPTAPTPIPTSAPIQTPTPEPAPAATPTPLPTPTVEPTPTPPPSPTPARTQRIDRLRQLALDLIIQDRAEHGLSPVTLGANQAAQLHARDLLTNDQFGHWWADGRKPYMVYTQTGGTSYAAENAATSGWLNHRWEQAGCDSYLVRCIVPTPEEAIRDHQWSMMYDDAHADWGHRDNILRETHQAVNIGVSWNNRRVVFVQHFEGGAVTADTPPSLDDRNVLSLSVTKNEVGIRIGGLVTVYYDPRPTPVSRELNDSLDSYCIGGGATTNCPDSVIRILDPPGPGRYYASLDSNEVVADTWRESTTSFSFSADVGRLMEDPGVYTVILWRDGGGSYYSEPLVELSVFVE